MDVSVPSVPLLPRDLNIQCGTVKSRDIVDEAGLTSVEYRKCNLSRLRALRSIRLTPGKAKIDKFMYVHECTNCHHHPDSNSSLPASKKQQTNKKR